MFGGLLQLTGCAATKPSAASGMLRIEVRHTHDMLLSTLSAGTKRRPGFYRTALVTRIEDKAGKVVYRYKDRGTFQYSIDLPAGAYQVYHTCYSDHVDYEKNNQNWNRYEWVSAIDTRPGDLYHLRANPRKQQNMEYQNRRVFDCIGLFRKE